MAESKTAVVVALTGNAALAVLKGIAAAVTGSVAMLAESLHSIADTGNQILLFLGLRLADRPPDRAHPFGHGKNVYFWAFVVSMLLFSVGGAFAIWEAARKILQPGVHTASLRLTYGVLGAGFVFEFASFVIAYRSLQHEKGAATFVEYWRDTRDPTVLTVLLEDSAALSSLVVAAVGIGLHHVTGDPLWDALASGVIGLILIGVAVVLAFETYSLLIGEAAPADVEAKMLDAVIADQAVTGIVGLYTMHVGPRAILVVFEVRFRRDLTIPALEAAVRRIQDAVREAVAGATRARLVVIEPAPGDEAVGRAA
jgi:cation diffusion facilitator family transporter